MTVSAAVLAGGFMGSKASAVAIAAIAGIAVAAVVYAVAIIVSRRQGRLDRRLAGYEPLRADQGEHTDLAADNKMIAGAVDMTRDIAERAGVLLKVEHALEQADLPLRAPELLFY